MNRRDFEMTYFDNLFNIFIELYFSIFLEIKFKGLNIHLLNCKNDMFLICKKWLIVSVII